MGLEGEMILERGDMWSVYEGADLFLFTGNSYINAKGELVMGRGLALEVKNRFVSVPAIIGSFLRDSHLKIYGVCVPAYIPEINQGSMGKLGVFQVKRHFKDKAELAIIGASVVELKDRIQYESYYRNIHLNFPGTGYGRLKRKDVLPIISELPDCVRVWER